MAAVALFELGAKDLFKQAFIRGDDGHRQRGRGRSGQSASMNLLLRSARGTHGCLVLLTSGSGRHHLDIVQQAWH